MVKEVDQSGVMINSNLTCVFPLSDRMLKANIIPNRIDINLKRSSGKHTVQQPVRRSMTNILTMSCTV